jgi:hypothetical protein
MFKSVAVRCEPDDEAEDATDLTNAAVVSIVPGRASGAMATTAENFMMQFEPPTKKNEL